MLLRLSCSVCCARALEGLVRAESLTFGLPRAAKREALESDKWGASDDRGQRAALTLVSPPSRAPRPPSLTSPRSPRSHIIYDSIRTQARDSLPTKAPRLIITHFSSHVISISSNCNNSFCRHFS